MGEAFFEKMFIQQSPFKSKCRLGRSMMASFFEFMKEHIGINQKIFYSAINLLHSALCWNRKHV